MRKLFYVPIIHTDPDLGSLGEGIEAQARAIVGDRDWQKHKEIVRLYWQQIADYWTQEDVSGFKIFQDGLPVDGLPGEKLVKDLADQGSINHQIIVQLMEKGATLVKTEDPELLKEEYFLTRALLTSKSNLASLQAVSRYRWRKDRLLKARDTYSGARINHTLREGETGICFLGAYHQLFPHIAKDVNVYLLKDPEKVRDYYQKLTRSRSKEEVEHLGWYLTSPIKIQPGEQDE